MRTYLILLGLSALLALSACGNAGVHEHTHANAETGDGHDTHHHHGSGELPAGLTEADNPRYPVGSSVTIRTDHMPGMNGAAATVSGAFHTTVYAVSYEPKNGGARVTDHEWVVHEELKDPGSEPLAVGAKATLEADHMEGMRGAEATIDSAERTTVYLVDYVPTTGGEPVTNHMWVVESELSDD
ncbi:YdhK family protein [Cohnella sp. GCM10027633]|uniref:YdhK family protein n=1 Tax=unclassified Cohnella TaxID=2636738 RepID=UPI003636BC76